MTDGMEMPKYQSHKTVWALKIKAIEYPPKPTIAELEALLNEKSGVEQIGAVITPEEAGYDKFPVNIEYVQKHNPKVGGYYVLYKDGYKSWSPAEAFEEGYTRISSGTDCGPLGSGSSKLK